MQPLEEGRFLGRRRLSDRRWRPTAGLSPSRLKSVFRTRPFCLASAFLPASSMEGVGATADSLAGLRLASLLVRDQLLRPPSSWPRRCRAPSGPRPWLHGDGAAVGGDEGGNVDGVARRVLARATASDCCRCCGTSMTTAPTMRVMREPSTSWAAGCNTLSTHSPIDAARRQFMVGAGSNSTLSLRRRRCAAQAVQACRTGHASSALPWRRRARPAPKAARTGAIRRPAPPASKRRRRRRRVAGGVVAAGPCAPATGGVAAGTEGCAATAACATEGPSTMTAPVATDGLALSPALAGGAPAAGGTAGAARNFIGATTRDPAETPAPAPPRTPRRTSTKTLGLAFCRQTR